MKKLQQFLNKFYTPAEYPALAAQLERWQNSQPFASVKILDGTPVFRNTMVKYLVLRAAGAELTVSVGKDIPYDAEVLKMLPDFGIKTTVPENIREAFDVVADCAGRHMNITSRCGYAELTRSGLEYYRNSTQPVFSVDSGILKRFETTLGTGESFVRAMNFLGYRDFKNRVIVIFGGGKVGRSTAFFCQQAGAETFIVDPDPIRPPENVHFVSAGNQPEVQELIRKAWCVVSATGLPGVLAGYVPDLLQHQPIIANMGVEDEFGSALPADAVLNRKRPLNFILDEPTKINYIDPSMALSNEALLILLKNQLPSGINLPPAEIENRIISDLRRAGNMDREINLILQENLP